jgi:hypothetical protein
MRWKLSDWASVAEIVAAIGVMFSLIFVGLQINDSNDETRAATIQAVADTHMFFTSELVRNAHTWDKVVTGDPLDSGEEMRKGILLYDLLMSENENRYQQFKSGYLDSQGWEGIFSNLRPITRLPMFKIWRASLGGKSHSVEFLALLDNIAKESRIE